MLRKLFVIGLAAFAVVACETTPDEGMDDVVLTAPEDQAPMMDSGDLMYDTGVDASGLNSGDMAAPGTQEDLIVSVGDRVFFGYDSSELNPEARRTLEKQAEWLKTYPSVNVVIEGHADERGTREYNLALGDRRATAVYNYLTSLGVPSGRVRTISYGKEKPAVMGSDPVAWARNRRGVMVVE